MAWKNKDGDPNQAIQNLEKPLDIGILCRAILLDFYRLPENFEQLKHERSPNGHPVDATGIVRAARQVGLKARPITTKPGRLEKIPLAAIAEGEDGSLFLLAKVAEGKALIPSSTDTLT